MRAIFISYRRSDAEGQAGHLFDDLKQHFGADAVFMDVAAVEAGRDFRKAIDTHVTSCGVLLAIIGKNWLTATNDKGVRRIEDPNDFVHLETASALKRDIPVIPVLVQGATMPRADELPEDLRELTFRNAVELNHARWHSDVALLIKALEPIVRQMPNAAPAIAASRSRPASRTMVIAGAGVLAVAAAAFGLYRGSNSGQAVADAPTADATPATAEGAAIGATTSTSSVTTNADKEPEHTAPQSNASAGKADTRTRDNGKAVAEPAPEPVPDNAPKAEPQPTPAPEAAEPEPEAEPALSYKDWEGSWNLRWQYQGTWYEQPMIIDAKRFGITGDYVQGTIAGRFEGGNVSTVVGKYTNTTGTGATCTSGDQTGSFRLILDPDGKNMKGWWDVCGEGQKYIWEARKR